MLGNRWCSTWWLKCMCNRSRRRNVLTPMVVRSESVVGLNGRSMWLVAT